jgi:hypothetical protein
LALAPFVPPYDASNPMLSVVPLVEPIRTLAGVYPGAYPTNIDGETPHTAMADQISALFQKDGGGDYVTVHTVVGESGQGIHGIDKTATVTSNMGHAYPATLFEVGALKRLAAAKGKTYGVGAIVLTHGETDAGNASYESDVYTLLSDYNTDIAAITGQTTKIPLLLTQQQIAGTTRTASLLSGRSARPPGRGRVRGTQVCVPVRERLPAPRGPGYDQSRKYARGLLRRVCSVTTGSRSSRSRRRSAATDHGEVPGAGAATAHLG